MPPPTPRPQTFSRFVEGVSPPAFAAGFASDYYAACFGFVADILAEGARLALLSAWAAESECPDDVLPYLGSEVRLPRYRNESAAEYRARILRAFEIYDFAGTPACINDQLAAAGYNGVVLFRPNEPGPNNEPTYRTQFWLLTTETDQAARDEMTLIARKWKPVTWIFRDFVFAHPGKALAIGEAKPIGAAPLG